MPPTATILSVWHRTDHINRRQHYLTVASRLGIPFGCIVSERSRCNHDPFTTGPRSSIQRNRRCRAQCTRRWRVPDHLSPLQFRRCPNTSSICRPSGQLVLSHAALPLPILHMPLGRQYCRRSATVVEQAIGREAASQSRNLEMGSTAVKWRAVAADFGARPICGRLHQLPQSAPDLRPLLRGGHSLEMARNRPGVS